MRIYISGKITGNENYMEEFQEAQERLEKEGHNVYNPAATNATLPPGTSYEEYMKIAMDMLDMAEGIFMLQGWEDSKGANREYGYALGKQKTIIFQMRRGKVKNDKG